MFSSRNGSKPVTTRHDEDDAAGLPAFDAVRWNRALPRIGDRAWVLDGRTGEPWRETPGRVWDKRGGVPRRGADGKPRRPTLVEFRISGYACWYAWYEVMVDPEVYP